MASKSTYHGNLGVCLTGFLLREGSHDKCLFDCLCVERCASCTAHMVGPELFVCHGQIIDADVRSGAGVQSTCGSLLEEGHMELSPMALGHGNEPVHSIDCTPCAWVLILLCFGTTIIPWWLGVVG